MKKKLKQISLVFMAVLYIGGGINHFIHPDNYYLIIPPYVPFPAFINIISGIAEIVLGVLLIFSAARRFAAIGIIVLLIFFIPAHVYMIQAGGCMGAALCIPLWVAWVRLFPLQLLLMLWAWWHRK